MEYQWILSSHPAGGGAGGTLRRHRAPAVVLTPAGAISAVEKHLGKPPELTAISLEQRGESAIYSVFGKNGAFLVNATTGEVSKPRAPSTKTSWVRNAHFFNFSGNWKTVLLLVFSFLSACSTLSGLWLALGWLKNRAFAIVSRTA